MITGLPTLELEADSECNAYYVIVLTINYKLQ